jgi:glycerol-3-phosphate dehydrogenase subunit B
VPTVDVVVVGAGLAGLSAAIDLAERGASVQVAAKGMAATHWAHGGLDVAGPPGASSPANGLARLQRSAGHPYNLLHDDLAGALDAAKIRLAAAGLPFQGDLATPLRPIPTAIGGLRSAAILPDGQAACAAPWRPGEGLLLLGIERYRDYWPAYAARNLARQEWPDGPTRFASAVAALPELAGLRNLGPLLLARRFDDARWRARAFEALARVVPRPGSWRIGLPAVLGMDRHAEVLEAAAAALGHPVFEIPSLPPSIPGLRLFEALAGRARELGVTVQIGFEVSGTERRGDRVVAVETRAAARPLRIRAEQLVLATGGIAGGGFRAGPEGILGEPVLALQVAAPVRGAWLSGDLYGVDGVELERAGIRVDEHLRPIGPDGAAIFGNVRVVGSALAGMRYLTERCGDGVALASAARAAREVAGAGLAPAPLDVDDLGPKAVAR